AHPDVRDEDVGARVPGRAVERPGKSDHSPSRARIAMPEAVHVLDSAAPAGPTGSSGKAAFEGEEREGCGLQIARRASHRWHESCSMEGMMRLGAMCACVSLVLAAGCESGDHGAARGALEDSVAPAVPDPTLPAPTVIGPALGD